MAKVRFRTCCNYTADYDVAVSFPARIVLVIIDQQFATDLDQSWAADSTETFVYIVLLYRYGNGLGDDPDHHYGFILPGADTHWFDCQSSRKKVP
jgi:hypothetical protein